MPGFGNAKVKANLHAGKKSSSAIDSVIALIGSCIICIRWSYHSISITELICGRTKMQRSFARSAQSSVSLKINFIAIQKSH